MTTRAMEIWVGAFVAAGLASLFMLAMKVSNLSGLDTDAGYKLTASFENIGGLKVRSPITASGVRVGRVSDIHYDSTTYQAQVILQIDPQYNQFPTDTSASIFTAGLLGEQYIALTPGAEEASLKDGDRITITESAIVLERLIGQFLYSKAAGDN
ncbi:MAG TPA: outer membrane lipid asymmetry maintenance protein MlaD [Gammaproteobacteria bacterium]|nr:outer membrane lipid asymmetry maintenance protein MlaD [Gammaproteobacteria bacterium]